MSPHLVIPPLRLTRLQHQRRQIPTLPRSIRRSFQTQRSLPPQQLRLRHPHLIRQQKEAAPLDPAASDATAKVQLAAAFGTGAPTAPEPNILSGQSTQPKVDGFTGTHMQRIALDIPPGRNGLQPDLALEYNSQNTDDNIVGYGWRISVPFIQRLNKTGSQDLHNIPTFTSLIDGELATTTASTTLYRARVDDGSFRSYNFSGNSWAVHDKNGTRYLYGATGQAQQSTTTSSGLVYKMDA